MKWTGLNELRETYLSFFESKQHLRLKSFPLVPDNDKSLLLINSGMAPMKKWFLGTEEPPSHRVCTCQKCIRTPDIESVGITARHGTFFEMLGNFSFQDYFKTEAIFWAWELFTSPDWLNIEPDKLYITVYQDDDEAWDIWTKQVGVPESHMKRLGKADNFWEHGSGPCGPCSEIHFDRGEKYGCGKPDCGPGCDCDRFMEIWNLVFSEFDSDGQGNYEKLEKPNIDTGLGLERLACIMQGVDNLFEVDTVQNILHKVEKMAGKTYKEDHKTDVSIRVITDHIRSTVFMVSDGILPSNEGRGYVLRRLLRRAARHGRMLGIERPFLAELAHTVVEQNTTAYPELAENIGYIEKTIAAEEQRFLRTIDQGLEKLGELIDQIAKAAVTGKDKILSGIDAFRLNDTFGFPLDLTKEIAAEAGITVDIDTFKEELKKQREKAREDRLSRDISGWEADLFAAIEKAPTEFIGYDTLQANCVVEVLSDGEAILEDIAVDDEPKEDVLVILNQTPFYAEGGGQVADTGFLANQHAQLAVRSVRKTSKGFFVHTCTLLSGIIHTGDVVSAEVDTQRRHSIMRNHTAVHLLQQALREVLGSHVHQAGSYVDEERLRFDFTHFSAVTKEELHTVEQLVNRKIFEAMDVTVHNLPVDEAKKMGAIALFGEKYGDVVRVIDINHWSCELCGGTHVQNTAALGCFRIISEASVAAGVRRIEGTTGAGVLRIMDQQDEMLNEMATRLKVGNVHELPSKVHTLSNELKTLEKEVARLKDIVASVKANDLFQNAVEVHGIQVITMFISGTAPDALRKMCDRIRENRPMAVGVLCGEADGKTSMVVCCGSEAIKRGLKAGALIKEIAAIAGGSGGGKPEFAMAGVKDPNKVDEALAAVPAIIEKTLL